MGRSQETFGKKEVQKNKIKKRIEKAEKMEERKANAKKGKSLEEMIAYLDEDGNFTSTPPDPSKRRIIRSEDMQIGVPRQEERAPDQPRNGVVTFFNMDKGYGFIRDLQSQESVFIHVNQLAEPIKEHDKVTFDAEMGHKGLNAINVKKIS